MYAILLYVLLHVTREYSTRKMAIQQNHRIYDCMRQQKGHRFWCMSDWGVDFGHVHLALLPKKLNHLKSRIQNILKSIHT